MSCEQGPFIAHLLPSSSFSTLYDLAMHQSALDVKRQLHGAELESRFIDLGYDLFNDRAFFTANFSSANLLSVPLDAALLPYVGKVDVVYEGSVIHLFDESSIITFIRNVKVLLKPSSGT